MPSSALRAPSPAKREKALAMIVAIIIAKPLSRLLERGPKAG
jgi:hypothetical protein